MDLWGPVEKGFGKVNSTVFRQVNRVTDWWNLPTPVALLNLRGLRDDLRESNLVDTRAPTVDGAPPTRDDLPDHRTYDGSNQDPTDPLMGMAGTRFGRNAPTEATEPEPMPQRMEPNPREVANRLLLRDEFKPATSPERARRLLDPVPEPRLVRPRRERARHLHRRRAPAERRLARRRRR